MGRREARKITRKLKQATDPSTPFRAGSHPELIATGRIAGGVSETYITFRSMPSADNICSSAIRKVIRGLTS